MVVQYLFNLICLIVQILNDHKYISDNYENNRNYKLLRPENVKKLITSKQNFQILFHFDHSNILFTCNKIAQTDKD